MHAFVYDKVCLLWVSEGHWKVFCPLVCVCVFEPFSASSPLHYVTHSSSGYNLAPLGGLWGPLAKLVSAVPGTGVAGPQPLCGLQNSNLSFCQGLPRPLKLLMAFPSSHHPTLDEWSTPTSALTNPLLYSHTLFLLSHHSSSLLPPLFLQGKIPSCFVPSLDFLLFLWNLSSSLLLFFSFFYSAPVKGLLSSPDPFPVSIFIFLSSCPLSCCPLAFLHPSSFFYQGLKIYLFSHSFFQPFTSSCNFLLPYSSSPHFLFYPLCYPLCSIFLPLPSFLHPSLPPLDFVPRVLCKPHTFLCADWLCLHWQPLLCAWTTALQNQQHRSTQRCTKPQAHYPCSLSLQKNKWKSE